MADLTESTRTSLAFTPDETILLEILLATLHAVGVAIPDDLTRLDDDESPEDGEHIREGRRALALNETLRPVFDRVVAELRRRRAAAEAAAAAAAAAVAAAAAAAPDRSERARTIELITLINGHLGTLSAWRVHELVEQGANPLLDLGVTYNPRVSLAIHHDDEDSSDDDDMLPRCRRLWESTDYHCALTIDGLRSDLRFAATQSDLLTAAMMHRSRYSEETIARVVRILALSRATPPTIFCRIHNEPALLLDDNPFHLSSLLVRARFGYDPIPGFAQEIINKLDSCTLNLSFAQTRLQSIIQSYNHTYNRTTLQSFNHTYIQSYTPQ